MALSIDPKTLILSLFQREEREGRGCVCARFPDGIRPEDIPLENGESVFGIYKGKYFFTPTSLSIREKNRVVRIVWADVRNCSSSHGEGKTFSELTLADDRKVRVRVGDMAMGWSGRISQLYHSMIERFGNRAAMGKPLMPVQEFFTQATDDYCIAPNLEPHPSLESFRNALLMLEQANDGTRILIDFVDGEDELVADAIVIVTPRSFEEFQCFADSLGADGMIPADDKILRKVGQESNNFNVWHILWD